MNILLENAKIYLNYLEYKGTTFHGIDLKEFDKEELMKIIEFIMQQTDMLLEKNKRRIK